MTGHWAASQLGVDVKKAHDDHLIADPVPSPPACAGPGAGGGGRHLAADPGGGSSATADSLAARLGWDGQPAAGLTIPAAPEAIKIARSFTRDTLRSWDMTGLADDAQLVVSELVTNALMHTRDSDLPGPRPVIGLRLMAQPPWLLCMVTDPSQQIPLPRQADPDDCSGRGLQVIESCSSRWGWNLLDESGKIVWALLPAG